jgi:electron transfer flavoprotein alpha subunit
MNMEGDRKDIWVFAQCMDGHLTEASLEVLAEAKRLAGVTGGETCVLLLVEQVQHFVSMLGHYGATTVYTSVHEMFSLYCPEKMTHVIADAIDKYVPFLVLFPGTHLGNDLACRVSLRIERCLVRNCVNFDIAGAKKLSTVRSTYNRRLYCTESWDTPPLLATLVPGTIGTPRPDLTKCPKEIRLEESERDSCPNFAEPRFVKGDPRTIDLVDAEIVVAGGRGLGRQDGLTLLQELADELGATLGVSRPLVDDKWAPFERQVGQTGRTIHPKLYIACGISGAIQHIMGIREAGTIVAINKDPQAPIFDVATLAVEGDLYQIVPDLIRCIRERNATRATER